MFGIVMAFQDFSLSKGVFGSTFVGPDNFVELFTGDAFLNAFKNTAIMAAFSLVLGFFPGLIFALMLSEVRNKTFKRTIQMISYLPNFVAAVVVTNLVKLFLGNDGPLTALLTALGLPQQNWLANANPPVFWLIHTFMGIWQSLGFGSILLMSAIANINGDIVEAAAIDGATRMQRILRITIPCIAPILGMSFVLNIAISFRTIGGNVLLLDEPSNDLDVETLRALEEALLEFAGCAMVTSHDRWFLDRIATHILAFEGDSKVVFFNGNYNEYEADKRRRLGDEAAQPKRLRFKPLKH